jgi:hypothetical protein
MNSIHEVDMEELEVVGTFSGVTALACRITITYVYIHYINIINL